MQHERGNNVVKTLFQNSYINGRHERTSGNRNSVHLGKKNCIFLIAE
jgi:hypothetical protein